MDVYDLHTKAANFASDDEIVGGFGDYSITVIERVAKKFQFGGEHLQGRLQYIGSCWDGSKIGRVNEIDSLYVMSDKHIVAKKTEKDGLYRLYLRRGSCRFELVPLEINRKFADMLDSVQRSVKLPAFLRHGGYASPRYSGVRYCGPAVTSQFTMAADGNLLTWDVTLAFPMDKRIRQQVRNMIQPIYAENTNKLFPHWELHLVPDLVENLWQVSTAWMEAEILRLLPSEAAAKRALSGCKALAHMLHQWNKNHHPDSSPDAVANVHTTDLMQKLTEYRREKDSKKKCYLRKYLNVQMRCAHIWIPAGHRKTYGEVEKDAVSINTAALKHIILKQGLHTPGAFSPDNTGDLTTNLIQNAYSVLGDATNPDSACSPHALLEKAFRTTIGQFSALPTCEGDRAKLISTIQWQCQQLCQNALLEVSHCYQLSTCTQWF